MLHLQLKHLLTVHRFRNIHFHDFGICLESKAWALVLHTSVNAIWPRQHTKSQIMITSVSVVSEVIKSMIPMEFYCTWVVFFYLFIRLHPQDTIQHTYVYKSSTMCTVSVLTQTHEKVRFSRKVPVERKVQQLLSQLYEAHSLSNMATG